MPESSSESLRRQPKKLLNVLDHEADHRGHREGREEEDAQGREALLPRGVEVHVSLVADFPRCAES